MPVFRWRYWKQAISRHFNNIYLPPARESWIEGSPETSYTEKTDAYNSMSAYPGEFAQLEQPSVFRDFRITRVSVFPVQYIAAKKELQVVSSITVRINYGPGEVVNPKTSAKKPIAPSFGDLYRSLIFNYQSVLDKSYGGKEEGHELMLCIMPDEFYASFQTYAEWKRLSGIDIHITKFSDIGANANDPTSSKTILPMPITTGRFLQLMCLLLAMMAFFLNKSVHTDFQTKITLLKLMEMIFSLNCLLAGSPTKVIMVCR